MISRIFGLLLEDTDLTDNDNPLNVTKTLNNEKEVSVSQEQRVEDNANLVLSQFEGRCFAELEQTLLRAIELAKYKCSIPSFSSSTT
jgi:hypothetical protein